MSAYPTLDKTPIVEALFDINVQQNPETSIEELEAIHQQIQERFTEKGRKITAQVSFTPDKPMPPAKYETQGFFFKSTNENKIFQARLNGFTFNKLFPYQTWDAFKDEARELWELYTSVAKPLSITRIALRYINKILIPLPIKEFGEYFKTFPQLSPNVPQNLNTFLLRLEIPDPESGAMGIIIQTIENSTEDGFLPVILDIDVIIQSDYTADDSTVWEDFEKLRNYKNLLFFECITEKTLELIK